MERELRGGADGEYTGGGIWGMAFLTSIWGAFGDGISRGPWGRPKPAIKEGGRPLGGTDDGRPPLREDG